MFSTISAIFLKFDNFIKLNPFFYRTENFNFEQRLRGGVYFVDSFAKTLSGKAIRKEITELASKMFKSTRDNEDAEIHSYLSDIPEEFRKFISYE